MTFKSLSARAALAGLAFAAVASTAGAQTPSVETMKAFSGLWSGLARPPGAPPAPPPPPPPPPTPGAPISTVNNNRFPPALEALLVPWAKAGYDKYKAAAAAVVDKEPPTPDNNCLPFAMPGEGVSTAFPWYVSVTPKTIGILMQIDTQMRLIHMDAEHPADLKPSMYGHSIGKWEGDTLVIDTIGFDDRAQFNDGFIHGPKLHAVERYRVIDNGTTLEKTYTFTDPDAMTGPYTFVRKAYRIDKPFQEYLNAQSNTLYQCPTSDVGTSYKPFR